MNCHRCGNILPANASSCPRCDSPPARTKRLVEAELNKTRALVLVERCENCGFLLYAGDKECQSCGAWASRSWQKPSKTTGSRISSGESTKGSVGKKRVLAGVVISLLLLGLTAIAWYFLSGHQQ